MGSPWVTNATGLLSGVGLPMVRESVHDVTRNWFGITMVIAAHALDDEWVMSAEYL